ncbi:hypothetical protein BOO69_00695 [Sulfitobacter alexandrii]|uniref:Sulfotransferase n=1 Tax=Sulfitobacter alexandrii TaxID=1917485 RepID=A0A1J0WCQ0_9RHOB|nr:sulfotransferase [Sulfitobacter alexandrii]APE42090.1 hypothetical protein BOO69_00695 [Sulfitobacter alexandrii]
MSADAPPIIAIGGLGGSGTRVFAEALRSSGIRIGEDLNGSLDNLWFTVLFKRRAWTRRKPTDAEVARAIRLFHQAMTIGLADAISGADIDLVRALERDLLPGGTWNSGARQRQVENLLQSAPPAAEQAGRWGWKEPNTHVFLPQLDRLLPNFRYVHVIRDGLDMAFSGNTSQTQNWAHLFGLPEEEGMPTPVGQLRYWLAANRAATSYGHRHMPGRFMVIRYEQFCARPSAYWPAICALAGGDPATPIPSGLIRPSTIGRSRDHDLSVLPQPLLDDLRAFEIDLENVADPS